MQRRLPKRGFKNRFSIEYAVVNLDVIDKLTDAEVITAEVLMDRGIVKNMRDGLKVLGTGEIKRPVTVKAAAFSKSASQKITAAGGRAEVL